MRFLSTLIASVIGTLVAIGLLFFFGFLFFVALVASSDAEPNVRAGSVLKLTLAGSFPEQADDVLFSSVSSDAASLSLRDVTSALRKAAVDDRITAVWLVPEGIEGSWSDLQEIRSALEFLKTSGKPLIASSNADGFTEGDYFLSSAADEVFAAPESMFEMNGFYLSVQFVQGLLEKLDVEALVIRAGNFKGAVEPFVRQDLSPENRAQLQRLVESVDSVFAQTVAQSRGLSVAEVQQIEAVTAPMRADEAAGLGLLDGLLYSGEVETRIKELLEYDDPDDRLRTISVNSYARTSPQSAGLDRGDDGTIAVVYAVGGIATGSTIVNPLTGETRLGSDDFVDLMERVRTDEQIKAIVLRIDSPGGAATASDVMWHAVEEATKEKPVIVSMGSVAASGGYYIAAPADVIVANPLTLTGSIGVFSLLFNVGEAFEQNLGVTFDDVQTAPYADIFSGIRGWTESERRLLAIDTDKTYETFLQRVAEGRHLSRDEVHAIAQGRIWNGFDARERGLVDELGGLDRSIELAAERAELAPGTYSIRELPGPKSLFEQVNDLFRVRAIKAWRHLYQSPLELAMHRHLSTLQGLLEEQRHVQARLPVTLSIR